MTPAEQAEWDQRLQDIAREGAAKAAAKRAERAAKKARRDAGLVQRHARKTAHLQSQRAARG